MSGQRRVRLTESRAARVVVPGVSVLVATGSAIVVNVLTTDWAWIWWPILGVLVVANVLLLVKFSPAATPGDVTASGTASVAAGGSIYGNTNTPHEVQQPARTYLAPVVSPRAAPAQ